jgi:phosphonoacetaldehyde hydrolase
VIPGVNDTVALLRARGIRVAATTGYNREMMRVVLRSAEAGGFVPDAACCAEDVPVGRPAPWMVFRSMEALGVFPPSAVVNIGDTVPDVASGVNAGAWSIGITRTGNMLGLDERAAAQLPPTEMKSRLAAAADALRAAGAHYAVESFAELPSVIDGIEARLSRGERP